MQTAFNFVSMDEKTINIMAKATIQEIINGISE